MAFRTRVCLLMLSIWGNVTWTECGLVRQCIDKFRIYQNHTMCIADPSQSLNITDHDEIVQEHNYIRGNVIPAAKKMMEIAYAIVFEEEAQTWADTCSLKHDDPYFRFIPGRYHIGQNIHISPGKDLSWSEVIDIWANESKSFTYNKTSSIAGVSNYVQLVWGDTQFVGCGRQKCGRDYFYVCNYAPRINESQFSTPYEAGVKGKSCKGHLSFSNNGLCSCDGRFCANGGTLNMTSCACQCVPGVKEYGTHVCELTCVKDGDHYDCKSMTPASCRTDRMAPFKCPWMCKVCPYSGKNYRQGSVPMPFETATTTTTVATNSGGATAIITTAKSGGAETAVKTTKSGGGRNISPAGAPTTGTQNHQRGVASGMTVWDTIAALTLAELLYIVSKA